MAQESVIIDRVRYPLESRSQRSREYKLASQNLWAKALSVIGVGILLLLAYALFPELPLVIIGVCVIFLGMCTLIVDRVLNHKCKKDNGRQENNGGDRQRVGTHDRHLSQSTSNSAMHNMTPPDIWTISPEWPYAPPTPPPIYTPTNPVTHDDTIELGPPPFEPPPHLGLPPPPIPLTPPPPLTPLPPRDNERDVQLSDSDEEDDDDTVTELPIMFPLRTRRRCISTPPLPSYEDVIEEDRQTLASASSMPSLPSYTSSSSSSSLRIQSQLSSDRDTALRLTDTATLSLSNSDLVSSSSVHISRLRAASLPTRPLEENP